MTDMATNGTCKRNCWIAASVIGVLVALFALGGHRGFVAAILLGILAAALLGTLFVWLTCAPVPKLGARKASAPAQPATPKPAAPAAEPKPAKVEEDATASEEAAAEPARDEPLIKPSKPLAGQAELASRKGDWKYEAEAAPVSEGEGTQPEALSAPRESGPDDLKEIKGVGPKLETLLHELGIYHFDQIAGWSAAEVAWMDATLKGFRGRVSRDDWIGQAKILAAGGETDFSTRVDKGEVY